MLVKVNIIDVGLFIFGIKDECSIWVNIEIAIEMSLRSISICVNNEK